MIQKDEAIKKGIKIIDSKETHNPLFENLKANFPQTIKDNQVDLKAIATLLGLDTKANIQGYELTFTGKALANALYGTPSQKTLKLEETFTYHNLESCKHSKESKNAENKKDSNAEAVEMRNCGFQGMSEGVTLESNDQVNDAESAISHSNATQDNAQNFIIKGDNLDVLKILKSAYSEKIKMIYIDPPYNTKNDNFIYPDNFRKDYKAILQEVGLLEIDDEGNEIESETLQFFKNIQSTRTHSGWLSFMLPRLKLARDLLREDGVIFISIDDNEQANLKILCDEIFGEENFVSTLIWRKIEENSSSGGTMKTTKNFRKDHEFIVCYAKNYNLFLTNKFLELPNFENEYKNLDNDPRGEFKAGSISMKGTKNSSKYYEIETPSGKRYSRVWRITKEEFQSLDKDNRIYYGKNRDSIPQIKIFINEERPVTPTSFFENLGSSFSAGEELNKIFKNDKDDDIFSNPKPINLIKRICEISTNADDIILDFFAGSGTTAQAVMELNAEDKGNRKFILVQIDEEIIESKSKTAYDFCKNELGSKKPVISDITIERVKRAGEKIANANPDFTICFSVLSLSDKRELITDKQGTLGLLSNAELSPFDKALNLSLQSGKTLDKPLKPIFENKLYQCEDCLYLVACDKEVLEFLRKTQNEYIFIDGFEDINLEDFLNLDSSLNDRLRIVY
ncbi:site-specific DNA-methyltransferase [Helicobacter trogontum]|uniref:site-specific DNA-methyltransferase (adenine-specific) n=1 Tax=Helicobacter trogontum TaxID=50960 RepID=A0A4V6YSC0_9HELI|nr:site-specific DNA-methyltransferase [Helicobacter trogontum]TLD98082.1 site-specific DNA-methyltransferase [Helicobacter trogontum]